MTTPFPLTAKQRELVRQAARRLWMPTALRGLQPTDVCVMRLFFEHLGLDALWSAHKPFLLRELQKAARRRAQYSFPKTLPSLFRPDALCGARRLFVRAWLRGEQPAPLTFAASPAWDAFIVHIRRIAQTRKELSAAERSVPPKQPPPVSCPARYADFSRIRFTKAAFPAVSGYALPNPDAIPEILSQGLKNLHGAGLFHGHDPKARVWFVETMRTPNLWFIGDIHGNPTALESLLAYIDARDPEQADGVVFLGDLIDHGPFSAECLLRFFILAAQRPGRVLCLCGNHEAGLACHAGHFRSSVTPDEFCRWLEGDAFPARAALGHACLRLAASAPRALFLPHGVWAAHGGFPFRDQWDGLNARTALNREQCCRDFVWGRFRPDTPRRLVNRFCASAEYGFEDIAEWFAFLKNRFGLSMHTFIRGHDHIEEGACLHRIQERYAVVTCASMPPVGGCVRTGARGDVEIVRGTLAYSAY